MFKNNKEVKIKLNQTPINQTLFITASKYFKYKGEINNGYL